MNVKQCKAGRALLGWTIDDLAAYAEVGRASVTRFEVGTPVQPETIAKLKAALEKAGVEFLGTEGVRLKK
ncbi:MAG: helix-turn-helix transcriptional regulator [Anaerolineae bacterium]|nr:helix-turn-helix transcriptional regulator [Anaerolineae bacterium]